MKRKRDLEKERAQQKRYREKYPEKHKEYRRKFYVKNRERLLAQNKINCRKPNIRFSQAKSHSKRRGFSWTLTLEEHTALTALPCTYCEGRLNTPQSGLDRLDHKRGYEMGNVVPCCRFCYLRKGRLEQAGFRDPRTVELMKELNEQYKRDNENGRGTRPIPTVDRANRS